MAALLYETEICSSLKKAANSTVRLQSLFMMFLAVGRSFVCRRCWVHAQDR
jgi:hypothetical protein